MTTQHTPGPWQATKFSGATPWGGPYWVVRSVDSQERIPAPIVAGFISDADAHLIAVAPELLAALRDAVAGAPHWRADARRLLDRLDGVEPERVTVAPGCDREIRG